MLSIIWTTTGQHALDQQLEDAVTGGRLDAAEWRHSSSCNGGNCLEVAPMGNLIAVRDSANADGVILAFSGSRWRDFIADVKAGRFEMVA